MTQKENTDRNKMVEKNNCVYFKRAFGLPLNMELLLPEEDFGMDSPRWLGGSHRCLTCLGGTHSADPSAGPSDQETCSSHSWSRCTGISEFLRSCHFVRKSGHS